MLKTYELQNEQILKIHSKTPKMSVPLAYKMYWEKRTSVAEHIVTGKLTADNSVRKENQY